MRDHTKLRAFELADELAFLTYSLFVGIYFSILLFFVFFAFLTLVQAAIDAVVPSAAL